MIIQSYRAASLGLLLLLTAHPLSAQPERPIIRQGDSTIVSIIDADLRARYPNFRPAAGLLTEANPLEQPGARGTEILAFEEDGRVTRIVASVWISEGKYAVEYFGEPGEAPRFIFESVIYRDDALERPASRNFWGQPSWERRHYLDAGRMVFTETIGDRALPPVGVEIHARRYAELHTLLTAARAARR